HATELAHQGRDLALLSERRDAHRLDRRLVGGVGDPAEIFRPDGVRILHGASPDPRRALARAPGKAKVNSRHPIASSSSIMPPMSPSPFSQKAGSEASRPKGASASE